MDEAPARALRRKPGATIRIAAELVARGEAAALFSAGHTGATVMAAHGAFGMLPGVDRPALAAIIPTRSRPAVLLDVGASVECRPPHLLQFAVMGSMYARLVFGIESPRVGLLSIGEEATKGNELTREAHQLLKASPLPFVGNIEARRVYSGDADVIVSDGFTGNVALKISEGVVEMVETLLREELSRTITICRQAFDEADDALGEPLSRICFEGPESVLTLTENTQPAILAVSIAATRLLASRGITPAFVAGHSLGEYSANVAAGTFAFADALRIVRKRGRYMQDAVPVGAGAMAAILGLDADTVARACAEAAEGDVVSPANLNGAGQVVIAGARE